MRGPSTQNPTQVSWLPFTRVIPLPLEPTPFRCWVSSLTWYGVHYPVGKQSLRFVSRTGLEVRVGTGSIFPSGRSRLGEIPKRKERFVRNPPPLFYTSRLWAHITRINATYPHLLYVLLYFYQFFYLQIFFFSFSFLKFPKAVCLHIYVYILLYI